MNGPGFQSPAGVFQAGAVSGQALGDMGMEPAGQLTQYWVRPVVSKSRLQDQLIYKLVNAAPAAQPA
jgi:hypothetical protein